MRKNKIAALFLALIMLLGVSGTALASDDDALSAVDFHDSRLNDEQARTLRDGVARLWAFVAPYAQEHGLDKFPRSDIYGYPHRDALSGICGPVSGCAYPGRAYVSVRSEFSTPIAAHEAMHLVQFELRGSSLVPYCISEGAAEWYTYRSVQQIPFEAMVDEMKSAISQKGALPNLSSLISESQFKRTESTTAYPLCFLAFDMLVQIEGGEKQGSVAYFNYLLENRSTDWRTTFSRTFGESFERFEERFELYLESGFENWKFPIEIEHEKFINKLLDCEDSGLWTRKVCAI